MHRLPSQAAINRFRLSAYLFILSFVVLIVGFGYLGWAVYVNQHNHIIFGSITIGVGILISIFQWIAAARARCPLCLVPSMAKKNCSKNRNARPLLGSYRMRVASSIILHGNFRCPYCNEPTVLEVRQRKIP